MKPIFSPTKMLDSLILMQIVFEGPQHGYALAASIEEDFGWKPSQTAVYNSLKSMESEELVKVEEKIESGRVQRIYSITKKGREVFKERGKKMREHMMKNMSQFYSFMQKIGEVTTLEESEAYQKRIHTILESLRRISHLTLILQRGAPKETQEVIENTLAALRKIAKKHDIEFQEIGKIHEKIEETKE